MSGSRYFTRSYKTFPGVWDPDVEEKLNRRSLLGRTWEASRSGKCSCVLASEESSLSMDTIWLLTEGFLLTGMNHRI